MSQSLRIDRMRSLMSVCRCMYVGDTRLAAWGAVRAASRLRRAPGKHRNTGIFTE